MRASTFQIGNEHGTKDHKAGIAVVGGGPAGLSLARILTDTRAVNVTVFERSPSVGGKSLTVSYGGTTHELGTCYSTLAHGLTNKWMRQMGMRQVPLGSQMVDGVPLMDFVRAGPGPSLAQEAIRYMSLWRNHTHAVSVRPDHPQVIEESATSIEDWLDHHKLPHIRRFMLRAVTNMGYGFLDQVSVLQALRWCTPGLIMSGALGQIKMPLDGWQIFWERLSAGLDVRTGEPVLGIERLNDGAAVTTGSGTRKFGHVIVTIPPDEAAKTMHLSAEEDEVKQAVEWGEYVTTLCEVDQWFTKHEAEAYSHTLYPGAPPGQLLSARRLPRAKATNETARIYLSGQYGGAMSDQDLSSRLGEDLYARGAGLRKIIQQKRWKYFPRYKPEAIRSRLVSRMRALQGRNGIWWSGAAFSHEAVSNIVAFNQKLSHAILQRPNAA